MSDVTDGIDADGRTDGCSGGHSAAQHKFNSLFFSIWCEKGYYQTHMHKNCTRRRRHRISKTTDHQEIVFKTVFIIRTRRHEAREIGIKVSV